MSRYAHTKFLAKCHTCPRQKNVCTDEPHTQALTSTLILDYCLTMWGLCNYIKKGVVKYEKNKVRKESVCMTQWDWDSNIVMTSE